MKILALLPLTFAAGAYTHAIDALQAEFLNLTTFPKDIDIETFYANYREKPDEVICETSDASPLYWHVSWLIDNLASETESNLCFSAKVGMSSVCGDTLRKWSGKGKSDGGAAFQLCRTDMSGASRNCKGGLPGTVECLGEKACGGYYPIVISLYFRLIREWCWQYDSNGGPRVGGIFLVNGGELRLYRMPG